MNQTGVIFGSVITAFILGASAAFGTGLLFSSGVINVQGMAGVVMAGLVAAAKDYRSLMKLPPMPIVTVSTSTDTTITTKTNQI